MEGNIEGKYFTWTDAWVFTALYYSHKNEEVIDLSKIIGAGDVLNHAIMTMEELKVAFEKLLKRGVIVINDKCILYAEQGKNLIEKIEKTNGGLFSRVDITLQKLNSNRTKLPFVEDIGDFQFITVEYFEKSYLQYKKNISSK